MPKDLKSQSILWQLCTMFKRFDIQVSAHKLQKIDRVQNIS